MRHGWSGPRPVPVPGLGLGALRPILDALAGDRSDIGPRLGEQLAPALEPVRDARRAAVVGGGRKAEIAEAAQVVLQQPAGLGDRLLGIERIGEPALGRGAGHELRDPLRAGPARDPGPEAALAPDQPRQEPGRQAARLGGGVDQAAQRLIDGLAAADGSRYGGTGAGRP